MAISIDTGATVEIFNYEGVPGISGNPHTFFVVTDANGIQTQYDFFPKIEGTLQGPGKVNGIVLGADSPIHDYTTSSGPIPIAAEQLQDLITNTQASINNPPTYDLPSAQHCTMWVLEMLIQSGILPQSNYPNFNDATMFDNLSINPYFLDLQRWALDPENYPFPYDFDDHATIPSNMDYSDWMDRNDPFADPTATQDTIDIPIWGRYDPLVLDLNGDGVTSIALDNSTAHFDLDGDGFAEKTGWIDGSDDIYAQLQVWKDTNGDGLSSAGELLSMQEAGVASMNLSHTDTEVDNNGNVVTQVVVNNLEYTGKRDVS